MIGSLYDAKWRAARAAFLRRNPLCAMCQAHGRLTAAEVVDHIVPHRGDRAVFWDMANWQPLCKLHHDAAKQAEEKSGTIRGCDDAGNPIDPRHHWNAAVR